MSQGAVTEPRQSGGEHSWRCVETYPILAAVLERTKPATESMREADYPNDFLTSNIPCLLKTG